MEQLLQELLQQLVTCQPHNPFSFICQHLKQKSNPLDKSSVERAIDIMNVLTVHDTSADSFDDRVYEVIKLLADPNTDVITSGIPFSNYEDFVHQLTKCVDVCLHEALLSHMMITRESHVNFHQLKEFILHFITLQEYCHQSSILYEMLERKGRVKQHDIEIILSELQKSMTSGEMIQLQKNNQMLFNKTLKESHDDHVTVEAFKLMTTEIYTRYISRRKKIQLVN